MVKGLWQLGRGLRGSTVMDYRALLQNTEISHRGVTETD
jgi:hypothetical protein